MSDSANFHHLASLMADPARARILWTLIDGTTRPAGDLAFAANISAQSASGHLAKLVQGGLLIGEAVGRHRYYRIADPDVAAVLEGLASLNAGMAAHAPRRTTPVHSMPAHFVHARTCYDHLAGKLAVRILLAMLDMRWLVPAGQNFELTRHGQQELAALGVDVERARRARRVFARTCIDLTERRPHVSGALGAALLDVFVREAWILRMPRSRVVSITPKGCAALERTLGVSI